MNTIQSKIHKRIEIDGENRPELTHDEYNVIMKRLNLEMQESLLDQIKHLHPNDIMSLMMDLTSNFCASSCVNYCNNSGKSFDKILPLLLQRIEDLFLSIQLANKDNK
jgi:hypothetical protein